MQVERTDELTLIKRCFGNERLLTEGCTRAHSDQLPGGAQAQLVNGLCADQVHQCAPVWPSETTTTRLGSNEAGGGFNGSIGGDANTRSISWIAG